MLTQICYVHLFIYCYVFVLCLLVILLHAAVAVARWHCCWNWGLWRWKWPLSVAGSVFCGFTHRGYFRCVVFATYFDFWFRVFVCVFSYQCFLCLNVKIGWKALHFIVKSLTQAGVLYISLWRYTIGYHFPRMHVMFVLVCNIGGNWWKTANCVC